MSSDALVGPGAGSGPVVPDVPVTIELRDDGTALVDGRPLDVPDGEDARRALMLEVGRIAEERGRPVLVAATIAGRGGATTSRLLAHPDYLVVPVSDEDSSAEPDVPTEPDAAAPSEPARPRNPYLRPVRDDERVGDADADADAGRLDAEAVETPQAPGVEDVAWDEEESWDEGAAWDEEPAAETVQAWDDEAWDDEDPDDRTDAGYAEDDPRAALVAALAAEGLARRAERESANPTPSAGIPLAAAERDPDGSGTVWRSRPQRRRRLPLLLGVVAMALVGATAATAFLGLTLPFRLSDPTAGPTPTDDLDTYASSGTGRPEALTGVALPPGTRAVPTWTVPVAEWTRTATADDGSILTRTPQGRVIQLSATTGQVLWASTETTTREQDGPWITTLGGSDVAAVVDRTQIMYWPLAEVPAAAATASPARASAPSRPEASTAATVDLPVGASASFVGSSPLVALADGRVVPVTLPEGMQALAADGTTVLAVSSTGWLRQAAGQPAAIVQPYPRPTGAGAIPIRVEAVGGSLLLTVWTRTDGTGQVVGLVDAGGDQLLAEVALDPTVDLQHARLVREPGGTQTLLGSVLVNTYTASVDVLDPEYVVTALTRGHAWATRNGRAVDIRVDAGKDFVIVPFGDGPPTLPVAAFPAAPGRSASTVVSAPTDDGWVLAALPQT